MYGKAFHNLMQVHTSNCASLTELTLNIFLCDCLTECTPEILH